MKNTIMPHPLEIIHALCFTSFFGGGPSKPPDPTPPPTETALDVSQEEKQTRQKSGRRAGRASTGLSDRTNPYGSTEKNTVLG